MDRKLTEYTFRSDKIDQPLRFAVAPDLHSSPFDDVLEEFARCDAVLLPGDLVDRHRKNNENAERFLRIVPEIVPVFYSVGNHERKYRRAEEFFRLIRASGVTFLQNECVRFRGICIGGLSYVVGNVNGKEIRSVHEPVHIVHVDVVGIHKVGFAVAHGHYGIVGLTTCVGGLCANYLMFTVGFVPDGNKLKRILACSLYECCQLSFSLM